MKLNTMALFVAGVLFGFASHSYAAASLDDVLAKSLRAHGGKEAYQKIKARVMKGTIVMGGGSSAVEIYAQAPNKAFSKTEIPGMGAMTEGFDGQVAWSKSPWQGLRVKTGDELIKARVDSDMQRPLKMKALYPGLTLKGEQQLGSNTVHVLEAKPSPTSTERFFIDTKSGLILQQQSSLQVNGTEVKTTARLSEYKPVDGIQYPHRVNLDVSTGGQDVTLVLNISSVTHPSSVDSALFAKPAQ